MKYFPDLYDPVDLRAPINWNDSLNTGLVSQWLNLPQGMWRGGNTWYDLNRNNRNDGTLTNFDFNSSVYGWRGPAGRPGGFGSVLFDGVDDYATIPDAASLDLTTGATVCCWVRIAAFSANNNGVIDKGTNGYTLAVYGTAVSAGQQMRVTWSKNGVDELLSGSQLTAGQWYHVAATHDNGTRVIYLNGVQSSTGSKADFAANTNALLLGSNSLAAGWYLNGAADAIRIYNRALIAAEVAALYADDCDGHRRTLRRLRRRYAVPSVASRFQAAWAAQSNRLIGGIC